MISSRSRTGRASSCSFRVWTKKYDHLLGGQPCSLLMSRRIQSVTVLVQRLSLNHIACRAHLIFNTLANEIASLILDRQQRSELGIPFLTWVKRDSSSIALSIPLWDTRIAFSSCLHRAQVSEAYVSAGRMVESKICAQSWRFLFLLSTSWCSWRRSTLLYSSCTVLAPSRSSCWVLDPDTHICCIWRYSFHWEKMEHQGQVSFSWTLFRWDSTTVQHFHTGGQSQPVVMPPG